MAARKRSRLKVWSTCRAWPLIFPFTKKFGGVGIWKNLQMPGGCPSWYVKALNWSTHENECWEKAYKLVCPKIILRSSQYIFLVTLRERVLNELCDGLLPYQTNFIFPKKARAKVCCLNFSLETQKESSQRMGEVDIIWRRMSCICRLKNVVLCWNSPNSKKLINWNWAWVWRRGHFI